MTRKPNRATTAPRRRPATRAQQAAGTRARKPAAKQARKPAPAARTRVQPTIEEPAVATASTTPAVTETGAGLVVTDLMDTAAARAEPAAGTQQESA